MDLIELGHLVKKTRQNSGLSQIELAEKSGVSRARIEALENIRVSGIGFKQLIRILNALGLDLRVTQFNSKRPTLEDLADEEAENHAARLGR